MPSKPSIPRVCRQCGKDFLASPSVINKGGGVYCSVPCRAIGAGKTRSGPNAVNWKGGVRTRNCALCGKPFTFRPSQEKRRANAFCSRACADTAKRREPYPEDRGYATLCIIWPGFKNQDGYAQSDIGPLHRAMYEATYGPVPQGMEMDHLCKQRDCINPDHVEPVTHTENIRRSAATKLDWPRVCEIRRLHGEGWSQGQLAARFGVGKSQIQHIVRLRQWREHPQH
jgi:hypothetical protein